MQRTTDIFRHGARRAPGCRDGQVKTKPSYTTEDVLQHAARMSGKRVLAGLPFGHVSRKLTLPVGLRVRMNARKRTVAFLEGAVR